MLNIYIDAREAFAAKKTGKGQWTYGFIQELCTQSHQITLFVDSPIAVVPPNAKQVVLRQGFLFHIALVRYIATLPPDLFISPTSFISPAFLPKKHAHLCRMIVHDLIAFRPGKHDTKARLIEKFFLPIAAAKATKICTVSVSTKDELLHYFPNITPNSVVPIFAGPMQTAAAPRSPKQFLLCAGTLCPRKNQLRLLRAFASLPDELQKKHPLILVGGRGWNDDEILVMIESLPTVEWKGYVSDNEYQQLLSECMALVYPSEYEGFGLQVLDALIQGVPVLSSQGGSLQELIGTAGLIVDPMSSTSIEEGLLRIIQDKKLRDTLAVQGPIQAKTFTWKRTVDTLLATL